MTVAFITLGCKVNEYETQVMRQEFEKSGFAAVGEHEHADVYVINTCCVTAESARKSRQLARRARRQNTGAVIVLCGCLPQSDAGNTKLPEADIVAGNGNKSGVAALALEFISNKSISLKKTYDLEIFEQTGLEEQLGRTRAFLKIEDGCDNFCAYCIIPYVRGRVRCKSKGAAVSEARKLIKNGAKEIILTGIHLASYSSEGINLAGLVSEINDIPGEFRIRLSSLEPTFITAENVEILKAAVKLCPHFHLSLQSGCNETLKRMNRKYGTARFFEAVAMLRESFGNAAVTTDIMTGFPGETGEEFKKSAEFFDLCAFAQAHIFTYSKRPGTAAEKMPEQIAEDEKTKRSREFFDIARKHRAEFFEKNKNRILNVLFEQQKKGFYEGFSENYVPIRVESDENITGSIKKTQIVKCFEDYCEGIIIE